MIPKVSVVLPVFNGQEYLRECINSVLVQTFPDFELLIGDDASTDASTKIVQSFSDGRIKCFLNKENAGLFKNLNQLIKTARAPIIRILCQDDLLENNCLEEEAGFFRRHPNIGMSFCKAYKINSRNEVISKGVLGDLPDIIEPSLSLQCFFYFGCLPGSLSTTCIRQNCFNQIGLFNELFYVAGDYEMWIRVCRVKNLGVIHKHLVRLRPHAGRLSCNPEFETQFIVENKKARAAIYPLLPKKIKFWARVYAKLRYDVLDVNYAMHCLFSDKRTNFFKVVKFIGLANFILGILFWVLTLNNSFYKPRPQFVK